MMAGGTCKKPQYAYAGLQKYLQQEWAFLQHATKGLGEYFKLVKKAYQESFLPDLFHGVAYQMPDRKITD